MKKQLKYLVALCLLMSACEWSTPYQDLTSSKEGVYLFIAKAQGGSIAVPVYDVNDGKYLTPDTVNFNVGYGGVGLPASNITVKVGVNTTAFDSINASRTEVGLQPRLPFPLDAYELDKAKVTIEAGKEYSDLVSMTITPSKFDIDKSYMLVLGITDGSGYSVFPAASKLIYIVNEADEPE